MSRERERRERQMRSGEGRGLIQGLLGGKGINKNRLFTEVTLKIDGYGGEKLRGGDGSWAAPGEISHLLISTRSRPDEDLVQLS